jgi:hypothetical protein
MLNKSPMMFFELNIVSDWIINSSNLYHFSHKKASASKKNLSVDLHRCLGKHKIVFEPGKQMTT